MERTPGNICIECGICCDGTMFSRLPAPPAPGAQPGPGQPCPAHRLACTIYKERPHACRAYRCALLERVADGEVGHADALLIIARTRELQGDLRAAMESVLGAHAGTGLAHLASRFVALAHPDDGPLREHPHRERAHRLLEDLDAVIAGHFRLPSDGEPGLAG